MTMTASEPVRLPAWMPIDVAWIVTRLAAQPLPSDQADTLIRLATDPRMRNVWKELTRRDRSSGGYVHPARPPAHSPVRGPDQAQATALAETLHFAFAAVRDQVRVTKAEEIGMKRSELLREAAGLRALARELRSSVYFYDAQQRADADGLCRVAQWREEQAAAARPPHDPMVVQNHRGDPVVRGVQVMIAAFLLDRFGDRLDGTAATLAAVGLGLNRLSERVSRSAFSGRKPT